jgi:hypothetical protein
VLVAARVETGGPLLDVTAVDVGKRGVAEAWADVFAGQEGVVLDGEVVQGQGGPPSGKPVQHRQHRGGPVEGLDLCFSSTYITTASAGRVQIEADDVADRLDGLVFNVVTTTCSTWASVMVRGRPGRGSSDKPSSLSWANRARHVAAVLLLSPNRPATSVLEPPSAHPSTIRARIASPSSRSPPS